MGRWRREPGPDRVAHSVCDAQAAIYGTARRDEPAWEGCQNTLLARRVVARVAMLDRTSARLCSRFRVLG
jgi:hypothetical protein